MAEEKPEVVYIPISTDTRNRLNELRRGRDTYNSVIRRLLDEDKRNEAGELKRAMQAAARDNPDAAEWVADVYRIIEFQAAEKAEEAERK